MIPYIRLTPESREALNRLRESSLLKDPVVVITGDTGVHSSDGRVADMVAGGGDEIAVRQAAADHARSILAGARIALDGRCVPRETVPSEFVIEVEGISLNTVLIDSSSERSVLTLRYVSGAFVLIDALGNDVLATAMHAAGDQIIGRP